MGSYISHSQSGDSFGSPDIRQGLVGGKAESSGQQVAAVWTCLGCGEHRDFYFQCRGRTQDTRRRRDSILPVISKCALSVRRISRNKYSGPSVVHGHRDLCLTVLALTTSSPPSFIPPWAEAPVTLLGSVPWLAKPVVTGPLNRLLP